MNLTGFADSMATDLGRPFDHMLRENIMVHFIENRPIFLSRDPNSKGRFPIEAVQDLGKIPVESVDNKLLHRSLRNCNVKRTKDKIPETVRIGKLNRGYFYVGGSDKMNNFDYVTPEEVELEDDRRVKVKRSIYTVIEDYIYLIDFTGSYINVRDVFVNPRDVYKFASYEGSDVGSDENFPVPGDLVPLIRTEIFNKLGRINVEPETEIDSDAENRR